MHPVRLRCSSLTYSRYARSYGAWSAGRLDALKWSTYSCTGPNYKDVV